MLSTVENRIGEIESIFVIGHASASGKDGYNMDLGLRRANQVKSLLIRNGFSEDIFKRTNSLGESELLEPEDRPDNNPLNRRVEVHFELGENYRGCNE